MYQHGDKRSRFRGINATHAIIIVFTLLLSAILYSWYSASRHSPSGPRIEAHQSNAISTISDAEVPRFREAARQLDPELIANAAGTYDSSFLNPCWRSTSSDQLRCLPYFFVSGFHTGAGALARRLTAHPNVAMDAGVLSPWGTSWGYWSEYRNTLKSYLDGIQPSVPKVQADPQHNVVMDGAMSTFGLYWAGSGKAHRAFSTVAVTCWNVCHREFNGSSGPGYERCMEERCLAQGRKAEEQAAANVSLPYSEIQLPMLMRAVYGTRIPKFVFLLRSPAERMYSAYFGTKAFVERYGNNTEGFKQYVADQVRAWHNCTHTFGEEACIMRFETLGMEQEKIFYHCDQILRGMYASYLKVWFRFFPRSSFLILHSGEYFASPKDVTKKVLEFLGLPVPEPNSAVWAAMDAAGPQKSNTAAHGLIPEGARRILTKLYRAHNVELSKLLGDKMWMHWNEQLDV